MLVWIQSPFKNIFLISEGICMPHCSSCIMRKAWPSSLWKSPHSLWKLPHFCQSKFLPGSSHPALTGRDNLTSQNRAGLTGSWQAQFLQRAAQLGCCCVGCEDKKPFRDEIWDTARPCVWASLPGSHKTPAPAAKFYRSTQHSLNIPAWGGGEGAAGGLFLSPFLLMGIKHES